jgi:hypothetical protein
MEWEPNIKLKMSKEQFLNKLAELYRVGNVADHESNPNKEWTKYQMAGGVVCGHIDAILKDLFIKGIITHEEELEFYDNL